MKTLHHIIVFGSVIILSISSSLIIFDGNKAQGVISKELIQGGMSQELTQDLANHGYAIVPSNTTEWFLWWNHYQDILNYSDIIFTGDIISTNILNVTSFYTVGNITSSRISMEGTQYVTGPPYKKINYTLNLDQYTVNVDEFLKNPQRSNNITIREPITDPIWHSDSGGPRFNVGDHVLFYVKNLGGNNVYSQMSFKIPKTCNAKNVFTQNRSVENINHFTANKPIQFMYNQTADTLSGKDSVIKYEILTDPSNKIILSKEINGSSKKCEWMESTKWELSLESGNYYSNVSVKNDDGTFRPTYSVGFSVNPSKKVPEFPFASVILVLGIVSTIFLYQFKSKIKI
ncbi:MAG: hypothetical protein AUI92_04715 [Thaumarchaeota archaeon 13_1_40CM_3_38_6]|nr:MAG: hypothetical protein AUI92_04715 [Thaumarchaeota archaeon 13_1_40CM_3_38_6]